MKLNGLDLFSGYGGISRALSPWVRTVAYCENDRYRQLVLLSEMQRGHIDVAPIWDDVRTLRKTHFHERINIITGGWPCQGHSDAGDRKGLEDKRSGLAEELIRLLCELRPSFAFLENVTGVFNTGFDEITAEISKMGYLGRYGVLSCADINSKAWHERKRVWIALTDAGDSRRGQREFISPEESGNSFRSGTKRAEGIASKPHVKRCKGWIESERIWPTLPFVTGSPGCAWPKGVPESTIRRKDDGTTHWRSEIETLGGGVVPQVAREAFKRLMGLI